MYGRVQMATRSVLCVSETRLCALLTTGACLRLTNRDDGKSHAVGVGGTWHSLSRIDNAISGTH